ncbi:patatin-like phospholipase family protein [Tamlana sp. s12]|uniref:patatin-like phospholipase family protein n=1 Tax=Tamlana sp. s12 TaxID=1630406 RepID=UPI0007FBA59D|nr:patatin-like phospholipase family protein [Tamlana sp. s12]OBQ54164.1 patatin [Tamlana sp. s12]QQY81318.1 patatin-like phospholipase family protein [Tamlana sp. s12]
MSQKIKFICLLILIICIQFPINAQEKKPKVALVLSGGGAKGVAHIPVLQKLDSLGIVPDLVVGTSMGSVVGGLYSMGYSGNDIASILNKLDWTNLLGGRVTLARVGNEEKSEFDNYLVGLNWQNKKPSISTGLLNDQNLRELLALLTYPVYGVHDFDELPIPYRAVATDIVHGNEVVIKGGSLLTAMRASMSIPSIFKPVEYEETLLVDGGILNNFPTDIAKNLGADIIIGSDVGGGLKAKDQLNSITTILFQTSMLVSSMKNPENRKLCDVLVNHTPNLTYSTGDFNKSSQIYEEGKIATNEQTDALKELAEKLKTFEQRKPKVPEVPEEFKLDTVVYKGISKGSLNLVKSRINFESNTNYTPKEIVAGIDRAMGTNLFNQIVVVPKVKDSVLGLEINGVENSKHQVKLALHYDTYRGLGAIVNYTGRNLLGNASRSLFTLDIAEQPKLLLQHQKIFGERHMWWWRAEMLWLKLKQKVYSDGYGVNGINNNNLQFEYEFNRNVIPNKSYFGFSARSTRLKLDPKIAVTKGNDTLLLDHYKFNNVLIDAHFNYNSFEEVFYCKRGTLVHASLGQSLVHNVEESYTNSQDKIDGSTNSYTNAIIRYERRFPVKPSLTAIIGANGAFTFEQSRNSDEVSFDEYGYGGKFFVGGDLNRGLYNTFIFNGLNEDELPVTQFMSVSLGLQYNPINKVYIKPHVSLGTVGFKDFTDFTDSALSPKGAWSEGEDPSALFSAGSTFSYRSLFGPINLDVSYVNDLDQFRVFLGIGFQFGRYN